jgi:hypothetical protein
MVTAIAILAALVGGGAVYLWERTRDDGVLRRALTDRDRALQQVATLTVGTEGLRARLGAATDRVARLEAALDRTRSRLDAIVGPALEDGRHFGYLAAVGATQEPPRLVFDLAEWYTDQEAVQEALADGVPRQEAGINGYYIRNDNPRWRVLPIQPPAPVTLSTYPYADPADPVEVTLERFAGLFQGGEGTLSFSPYWLTVRDGVVVAIEEQFVP